MFRFVSILCLFSSAVPTSARRTNARRLKSPAFFSNDVLAKANNGSSLFERKATGCTTPLSAEQRIKRWHCEWCEEQFNDAKPVWVLGEKKGKPHELGVGGHFQVFKVYKYDCPELAAAFLKPLDKEHAHDSAELMAKYQEAANLVDGIEGMLMPLAFGPPIGTKEEQMTTGTWSHGIVFPVMEGSLQDWMKRMNEDHKQTKIRYSCLPKIAKWLVGLVHQLHSRGISHCDIKPENILIRYGPTESDCPETVLADYDGLARPGKKCDVVTEHYVGSPVGDQTPAVIDWRATFATIIEIWNPDLTATGAVLDMFNEYSYAEEELSAEATYDAAVSAFKEIDESGGGAVIKGMEALLKAILATSKLDEKSEKLSWRKSDEVQKSEAVIMKKAELIN